VHFVDRQPVGHHYECSVSDRHILASTAWSSSRNSAVWLMIP
jgi:hypothetical protein